MSFEITNGDRVGHQGKNGSGETTFLRILTGEFQPSYGDFYRAERKIVYADQHKHIGFQTRACRNCYQPVIL
ncbi:ATP-binding cassette domain-containing protein [uncultured Flavobacterium sp.]|uniref:ATP-binding cassette domain-containing protein n=1 Tax=uncultured Flavobacterium sp. TaxID=165435 RepID=UPI00345A1F93